jgi:predicted nucleotide-binding protein
MPYYHVYVRFLQKGTTNEDEAVEFDFSGRRLKRDIVQPFIKGSSFLVGGCLIDPCNIVQLSINETGEASSALIDKARHEGLIEDKDDEEDYVLDQGMDVTRRFITLRQKAALKPKGAPERKNVFIVHGKDPEPVKKLKEILIDLGLSPIVLHEQASAGRTIVEKLEKYSDVGFAFVILTPDDGGGSFKGKVPVLGGNLPEGTHFRARQNVILELGYFIGLLGRDRVCCLYKGDVDLPSDMQGIVYISFSKSIEEARQAITKELRAAGYKLRVRRIS